MAEFLSHNYFKLEENGPRDPDTNVVWEKNIWTQYWIRTGIFGTVLSGGQLCTLGRMQNRITISDRFHDTEDMIVSIIQQDTFAYKSRITIFDIACVGRQRICIVAEQPPDIHEEMVYNWMNTVMSVINNRHHESVFLICTVSPGVIPRRPDGGVDLFEVKARLLRGTLHPLHIICCPHSAIHNLPRAKDKILGMGPNSLMQGFVVAGAVPAHIVTKPITNVADKPIHQTMSELAAIQGLMHNVIMVSHPKEPGSPFMKITHRGLHVKSMHVAKHLLTFGVTKGDRLLLCLRSTNLCLGIYACLMIGCIPVPARPPTDNMNPTIALIARESKAKFALAAANTARILRKTIHVEIIDIDGSYGPRRSNSSLSVSSQSDVPKMAPVDLQPIYTANLDEPCIIDFNVSTGGILYGRPVSFREINFLCAQLRDHLELKPMANILSVLEPYYGLGIILAVFLPVYTGGEITFLSPSWAEIRRERLLDLLQKHELVFLQSSVIEGVIQTHMDDDVEMDMRALQSLVLVYQSRVCGFQLNGFKEAMARFGLVPNKISTIITSSVVPIITLPNRMPACPVKFLDRRSLRNDKILFTSQGNNTSFAYESSLSIH